MTLDNKHYFCLLSLYNIKQQKTYVKIGRMRQKILLYFSTWPSVRVLGQVSHPRSADS